VTASRSDYQKKRYYERRAYAIEKLGGKCVICGSTEDLQLDHIIPADKEFQISQIWSYSKEKFDAELAKCQLLCPIDHRAKNLFDAQKKSAMLIHGTLSSYRYCKCKLCRKAYSDYWKKYSKGKTKRPIIKL
jgi:hypothetical protein